MNRNRRGFLGLMASAPLAAKAVAESAAAKMGLKSMTSPPDVSFGLEAASGASWRSASDVNWVSKALADLMTDANKHRRKEQARHHARTLDPDLAAMRSLSPSAAYKIQCERCEWRILEDQRRWIFWDAESDF